LAESSADCTRADSADNGSFISSGGIGFATSARRGRFALDAYRRLDIQDRGYGWTVEMQVRAVGEGLRIAEIPVLLSAHGRFVQNLRHVSRHDSGGRHHPTHCLRPGVAEDSLAKTRRCVRREKLGIPCASHASPQQGRTNEWRGRNNPAHQPLY
jgi:hypothetical protein